MAYSSAMRGCYALIVAVLLAACPSPTMLPSAHPSVRPHSYGTGFLINFDGQLLTAKHVVDECSGLTVSKEFDGQPQSFAARLIAISPDYDLAVVEADLPLALDLAPIFTSRDLDQIQPAIGDPVTVGGYSHQDLAIVPDEIYITTSRGSVRSATGLFAPQGDLRPMSFVVAADIQRGGSGTGVFTDSGALVGLIYAIFSERDQAKLAELGVWRSFDPGRPALAHSSQAIVTFLDTADVTYWGQTPAMAGDRASLGRERIKSTTYLIRCFE